MYSYIILVLSVCLSVNCQYLNQTEGSKCHWNGVTGTCVDFNKCLSAPSLIRNRTHPPICSLEGRNGPTICCTDCHTVEDIRTIKFNNNLGFLKFDGPKAKDRCLSYIDTLPYACKSRYTATLLRNLDPISNCYTISQSKCEFSTPFAPSAPRIETYMALLAYKDKTDEVKLQCAGAIISERYVLTSAQCVLNRKLGPVRYVAVDFEKSDIPLWQMYKPKRTVRHPKYRSSSKYHDIALVETKKRITFSEFVLPACLHTEQFDQKKANAIVRTAAGADQGSLTTVTLSELDDFACTFLYSSQDGLPQGFNKTIQACFGSMEKTEDSCLTESGSPLMAEYEALTCAPVIFGVTSIDRICGPAGSSGLYTRVSYYVPWIESIVWP